MASGAGALLVNQEIQWWVVPWFKVHQLMLFYGLGPGLQLRVCWTALLSFTLSAGLVLLELHSLPFDV